MSRKSKPNSKQKARVRQQKNLRPLGLVLIILALLLLFAPFSPVAFILAIFGMGFVASGLFLPPVFLVNLIIIILFSIVGRVLIEKKVRGVTIPRLIISCICVLILATAVTIPVYRTYKVASAPSAMKAYLEKRYGKEFIVLNAEYTSSNQLGTVPEVRASAYPVNNPSFTFSVSEDSENNSEYAYDDSLLFMLSMAEDDKAKLIIGTKLTDLDSDIEFKGRVVQNPLNSDIGYEGYKGLNRQLAITLNEASTASDWPHYKTVMIAVNDYLKTTAYKDIGYTFDVRGQGVRSTPSDLSCTVSPEDMVTNNTINAKFGECAHKSYIGSYLRNNSINLQD